MSLPAPMCSYQSTTLRNTGCRKPPHQVGWPGALSSFTSCYGPGEAPRSFGDPGMGLEAVAGLWLGKSKTEIHETPPWSWLVLLGCIKPKTTAQTRRGRHSKITACASGSQHQHLKLHSHSSPTFQCSPIAVYLISSRKKTLPKNKLLWKRISNFIPSALQLKQFAHCYSFSLYNGIFCTCSICMTYICTVNMTDNKSGSVLKHLTVTECSSWCSGMLKLRVYKTK